MVDGPAGADPAAPSGEPRTKKVFAFADFKPRLFGLHWTILRREQSAGVDSAEKADIIIGKETRHFTEDILALDG